MNARSNGQGDWFDQQLQQHPDLPDRVKQSYTTTRGYFSDDNEAFDKSLNEYLTPETGGFDWTSAFKNNMQGSSEGSSGTGGYWDSLLQRLDATDKQTEQRQVTDNRKFDYHFEINAAPGQSEQSVADAVVGVTKTSPVFTGNNSMTDGGDIW